MSRLGPILLAVRAKVESLALAVSGVTLPVLARKAPVRRQKIDPRAVITVSKSATPEAVTRWTFGRIRTDYLIDVCVCSPYLGPDGAEQDDYATVRDQLVTAFSRPPLEGAPSVFDVRATPADWLRPLGEATEWDWQSLQVTASVVSANGGA